jgi:hypothetical protein
MLTATMAHCSICNSLRSSLSCQPNESAVERKLLLETMTMQPSTHWQVDLIEAATSRQH